MFFPPHHKSINAKPAHSHARSSTSLMKTLKGLCPLLAWFRFSFHFSYILICSMLASSSLSGFFHGQVSVKPLQKLFYLTFAWSTLLYVLYMFLQFYLVLWFPFSTQKRILGSVHYRCHSIRVGAINQLESITSSWYAANCTDFHLGIISTVALMDTEILPGEGQATTCNSSFIFLFDLPKKFN